MPIRQRVATTSDLATRAADERGVFDPKKNAYDGSTLDLLGVPPEKARAVSNSLAFAMAINEVPPQLPSQMRVQDLLANLRMMDNPGDNVERTYRHRIRSPLTAIRAFCVMCAGGPKAANLCSAVECPMWCFRRGKNAMRNRR